MLNPQDTKAKVDLTELHATLTITVSEIHNWLVSGAGKTNSPIEVCITLYNAEELINNVDSALKYKDITFVNAIIEQIRVSSKFYIADM